MGTCALSDVKYNYMFPWRKLFVLVGFSSICPKIIYISPGVYETIFNFAINQSNSILFRKCVYCNKSSVYNERFALENFFLVRP